MMDNNDTLDFAVLMTKLKPRQFLGVAKLLNAAIHTEEIDDKGRYVARDAEDIFTDCCNNYGKLNRAKRRKMKKLILQTIKENEK